MNKNNLDKMLHKYIEIGDLVMVKGLIMAGADLTARTEDGLTPLHLACHGDNPEIVKFLVSSVKDDEIKGLLAKSSLMSEDVRHVLKEAATGRALDEAGRNRQPAEDAVRHEPKGVMLASLGASLALGSMPGSWSSRRAASCATGMSIS
jgi:ankyrin repeat protein